MMGLRSGGGDACSVLIAINHHRRHAAEQPAFKNSGNASKRTLKAAWVIDATKFAINDEISAVRLSGGAFAGA